MPNPARSLLADPRLAAAASASELSGLLSLLDSAGAGKVKEAILAVRYTIAARVARIEELASGAALDAARLSAFHDGRPDSVERQSRYTAMSAARLETQLSPLWAELDHFLQEETRLLREARRLVPGIPYAVASQAGAGGLESLAALRAAVAEQRTLYEGVGLNPKSAQLMREEISGVNGKGVGLRVLLWRLFGAAKIASVQALQRYDANNAEHRPHFRAWREFLDMLDNAVKRMENNDTGWTSSPWAQVLIARIAAPPSGTATAAPSRPENKYVAPPGALTAASAVRGPRRLSTPVVTERQVGELMRDAIACRGA